MATYRADEIYRFAREAGFSPDQATTMTAIALAESGGNAGAHNPNGEDSRGLWQVNLKAHASWAGPMDLYDPVQNAQAAYRISGEGRNISPWTVTHGGDSARYLAHLQEAQDAAAANGEPDARGAWAGVQGYGDVVPAGSGDDTPLASAPGAPLLQARPVDAAIRATATPTAPTPPLVQTAPVDPVAPPPLPPLDPSSPDSDGDGLTDALEARLGLDATSTDTDGDGLSDSYELRVGTDALRADSDFDGLTDAQELTLGLDPTLRDTDGDGQLDSHGLLVDGGPDSDGDGLGDALEAILGTDAQQVDSDDDGFSDRLEFELGGDPLDRAATPVDPDRLDRGMAALLRVGETRSDPAATAPPALDAPPDPAGDGGVDTRPSVAEAFVARALDQSGDAYVWGTETDADDDDPDAFDCSELVQWAAAQVGVDVPDGSWIQYLHAQQAGTTMSVDEALRTPGALLFSFSSEPTAGGGRPTAAHVAISLGDGTTIEARGKSYGVGTWEAGSRFGYAATVPGMDTHTLVSMAVSTPLLLPESGTGDDLRDQFGRAPRPGDLAPGDPAGGRPADVALDGPDTDGDGLTDALEAILGTDATVADTDGDGLSDAYELLVAGTDALRADTDLDGLTDAHELTLGLDPTRRDTDGDGQLDSRGYLDLAGPDTDGDGLSDALEAILGTDPFQIDSDGDGFTDGLEFEMGSDPFDVDSTPMGLGSALLGIDADGDGFPDDDGDDDDDDDDGPLGRA